MSKRIGRGWWASRSRRRPRTSVSWSPADLAFDRSELLALAAGHRLLLTDEETTILLQRTAGWVTGLMLIVPFLHGRNDSARLVVDFDGDDPAVAGFLRSEIIDG
ncbi:hypothetical protein E3T40_02495 [Cryobacterium sp. TMT1-19]|uniref:hypothetical protein n=1 Tax=Cryobacterium sp. TMT1-19 TaxID=1259231 RepID=UPI00106D8A00|nr:hypothetical protein [Cryobacterium sp. TMT1-19]TFD38736.1 hypothetical protein E3T40_02495 [Cryobacterium sp. TMT1-19]